MNKLFEIKFGSHLYGTNTENSDTDLKSIYLPTAKQIVLGNYPKTVSTTRPKQEGERNNKDDIDIEVFSLDRYLKLLSEGQTVAIDVLFANASDFTYMDEDNFWIFQEIWANKNELITKDVAAFMGYAKQQAAKYGLKGFRVAAFRDTLEFLKEFDINDKLSADHIYPKLMKFVYERPCANPQPKSQYITIETKFNKKGVGEKYLQVSDKYYPLHARVKTVREQLQKKFDEYGKRALLAEKNEGVDWKACSHAVRVNSQGVELLTAGKVTFPRPDKELLLKIKTGQMPYKEVEGVILQGFQDLKDAQTISTLRSTPNQEWIDNFVAGVYSDIVKGNI